MGAGVTYRVLVTDYQWPDLSVERSILEPAGIELVDASVLRAASRCRTVARYGAGLDNIDVACATELGMVPLPPDHPLRTYPNVLITPHMAFSSDGSVEELAATAARNVLDVLQGRRPAHVVVPR